jgi:hypothetical protein
LYGTCARRRGSGRAEVLQVVLEHELVVLDAVERELGASTWRICAGCR